jgi:hypothetical protein
MDATGNLSSVSDGDRDFTPLNCREPTIIELLADPMTRALMKADHIDVPAFEQMLRSVAGRFAPGAISAKLLIEAFEGRAGARFGSAIVDYSRWTSLDLLPKPKAAQSTHGSIATKASRISCGSNCSW